MKKNYHLIFALLISCIAWSQNQNVIIDDSFPYYVNNETLGRATIGGDTIFISSLRTKPLKFQFTNGDINNPLVIINKGGQVKIESPNSYSWGAITFENCRYIKISGAGHPNYKYGFELSADQCGLAFSELSSDCEAEFVKISHDGFFGIMAKKNYEGNPPSPHPLFENLIIHDCFIENVSEGMYLGETKSPGMDFKHVKIYNNIVRNTLRESIQIANMIEDVEIYNNTLLNAGLENMIYQTSLLQIGDNSVANVYNNILIEAPTTGIAVYGKGPCIFTNNYLSSNMGMFVDNRIFTDSLTPINIEQNYFRAIKGNQIIKNYNEINYVTVQDNNYETDITFFLNQSGNSYNFTEQNNTLTNIPEIAFTDPSSNNYALKSTTPIEYQNMGAPSGPEYFDIEPEEEPMTLPQIITPITITDLVEGGSINPPSLLFDEQNLDIQANEHATSNSWKPDYVMNETAYHVIVDLGNEYHISEINLHDMHDTYNFTVEYGSESNWSTLFTDPCDRFKTWSTHKTDISTRYLRFSLYQNVYAAVNEIIIYGYPVIKETEQIVVTSDMITDLTENGSINSPLFLFDEQHLNIETDDHATSTSWKPDYIMNETAYHTVVDLGAEYHISEINLHDMHDTYNFTVEYGSASNWSTLFIDPCDRFKTWSTHETDISTRYLRFSMYQNVYAAVNEIIIYGYALPSNMAKSAERKPTEIIHTDGSILNADNIEFYPNPVNETLHIKFPFEMTGKNNLVIKDMLGKTIYNKEVLVRTENPFLELTNYQLPKTNGIYVLSIQHESGAYKILKFIKEF
ncbi:T9SS type A sorting domain-containing protein [Algibacter pacificus]|uniref:T9SS type A sorting domain-containing protein n=1 Tax=Algibacter pacificus TaxID=2599389 RepID=UPI0011CA1D52|nr:T9SS type A sorting domain-containing protein [Algibacter pacificus]